MQIYSKHYSKLIELPEEEAKLMLGIYIDIVRELGLESVLEEDDYELLMKSGDSYYDLVAPHVEEFGIYFEGYSRISYLFD